MKHEETRRSHRVAGFTLTEALIVVAIIGISAALAAPSLGRAMAERRANEASHSLVGFGMRARSQSIAYGRAFVLHYSNASGSGTKGSVEMWRGLSDRCGTNDWATIMGSACSASGGACVDVLDMEDFSVVSSEVRLRLPDDPTDLCFEPNGDMFVSVGGAFSTASPTDANDEGVTFTLQRYEGTTATGVQRQVVFPFGGEPRLVR